MIAMFSISAWHPSVWLAAFCVPLVGMVVVLACLPRRRDDSGEIRLGNPLLRGDGPSLPLGAQLAPLAHLFRTQEESEVCLLVTGMRHLPMREAVPLLRRQLKNHDPEIQLHAQCVLQEAQSTLHARFEYLAKRMAERKTPAVLASYVEAGLALLQSPLTPPSEHPSIVAAIYETLSPLLAGLDYPRAVHAAARYFLELREIDLARVLHARLPSGSPLHADLAASLAHHAAIRNPSPPAAAGYHIT